MGKWRMEGRVGLQGTDWYVQEWVPNPNPDADGSYRWVANARDRKTAALIETAPELLAALEEILEGNRNGWIARVAREAIAKAKGGE